MKLRTGLVLAVILVLGVTGHFLVRSAEDRVTANMLSRVERFAIPLNWQVEAETVRPERFLCISTNPCPSFYRRWNTGKELTAAEVSEVVSKVGFEMKTSQICQRQSNAIGPTTACNSKGTDGEYDYLLNVTSPDLNEPQVATLIIRPHQ
ncbi:hypothetical protein QF038_001879 [Pseudarthrobacter sp. W1I19]|uniref:hypothetical protein n=1 Tax=Pseudarthrobacter sp. W1I19 TaxID=3042288 RepID=UPI002786D77F|nr:hypothetical protein [Pseudarthrobacter sp. W1I19]MDQ0923371.1 hypothetical protein [Pseudarthrobacter sp. W1I19]